MSDTSAEAVERLAYYLDFDAPHKQHIEALGAATLRALLAERDAVKVGLESAAKALEHNHDEWLKMRAERDRLREALRIAIAAMEMEGLRTMDLRAALKGNHND